MIPKVLHEHIDTAFPANVCLIGVALPDGYAQITPRGLKRRLVGRMAGRFGD